MTEKTIQNYKTDRHANEIHLRPPLSLEQHPPDDAEPGGAGHKAWDHQELDHLHLQVLQTVALRKVGYVAFVSLSIAAGTSVRLCVVPTKKKKGIPKITTIS